MSARFAFSRVMFFKLAATPKRNICAPLAVAFESCQTRQVMEPPGLIWAGQRWTCNRDVIGRETMVVSLVVVCHHEFDLGLSVLQTE